MRCIYYSKFGAASEVLHYDKIDTPSPDDKEVLVRVHFSGVNPSDSKSRAGFRPGITKPEFKKIIPNSDGSGVIVEVGKKVSKDRIGQRVWIWNAQWKRAYGTAAEFVCLPGNKAIEMPFKMSFEVGACLGIPGLTAAHCVLGDGSLLGKTVLISGGAGSVGNIAIQLAKWSGATVISTGSPSSFNYIKMAGADYVLDYNDPNLAQKIFNISPEGVDRAVEVEFGTNTNLLHKVVRANGTISIFGSTKEIKPKLEFGNYLFKGLILKFVLIYILPDRERITAIDNLHRAFSEGALKPSIDKIYTLPECSKAHDHTLKKGRNGAILLKIID